MNDSKGLGQLGESPLEAKQKLVRKFRKNLTNKTDQDSCMNDTCNRLHCDASPILRKYNPKPIRMSKKPREDLTDDDVIVKSFFISDSNDN